MEQNNTLINQAIDELDKALENSDNELIVDYFGGLYSIDSGKSYSDLTYENLTYDLAQV